MTILVVLYSRQPQLSAFGSQLTYKAQETPCKGKARTIISAHIN